LYRNEILPREITKQYGTLLIEGLKMTQNDAERIVCQLKENLLRWMPEEGDYTTPVEGVEVHRRDRTGVTGPLFSQPVVAVMVQGRKRPVVGPEERAYDAEKCLIISIDVPSVDYIIEASAERPGMGMSIRIDRHMTASLTAEIPPAPSCVSNRAMTVSDTDLLDVFLRLSKLFYKPNQVPFLAPMLLREIHYLLLTGPLGNHLKEINTLRPRSNRIVRAIGLLRKNYKNDLCVEELARQVNMAASTFHRQFKEATTLSPLQYQKHLRLCEAQRLMVAENTKVGDAAYLVGYESLTQFGREYKRLFGEPPYKNTKKLRE
jgi:AraC-like DNA-binding protein